MTCTVRPPKPRPRLSPDDRLNHIPYAFRHTSATLGWRGLRVEFDAHQPPSDVIIPPLEWLWLVLAGHTIAERTDHRCQDTRFVGDGPAHALIVIPPGLETRWRWHNPCDSTHVQLSPGLIAKVAEEAFNLDRSRVHFPVRYFDRSVPEVCATITALQRELLAGGPGGRLCAESLANVLVVQLLRTMVTGSSTKEFARKASGRLPRHALRAVEAYIEAHLEQDIALADLAAVAHLSEFHFARQFKQSTGRSPHQFVIHQRVERAKRLIAARELPLAQIATDVGFSDQSQLTRHFKRIVGVTPGRFA